MKPIFKKKCLFIAPLCSLPVLIRPTVLLRPSSRLHPAARVIGACLFFLPVMFFLPFLLTTLLIPPVCIRDASRLIEESTWLLFISLVGTHERPYKYSRRNRILAANLFFIRSRYQLEDAHAFFCAELLAFSARGWHRLRLKPKL